VFDLFPRLVRDMAHEQGKELRLTIEGETTAADKRILEELKDPLMHIIRNAVDHGIELPAERERSGKPRLASLNLRAYQTRPASSWKSPTMGAVWTRTPLNAPP
jgi:two-component system chemotaxis sensor kinase CheA